MPQFKIKNERGVLVIKERYLNEYGEYSNRFAELTIEAAVSLLRDLTAAINDLDKPKMIYIRSSKHQTVISGNVIDAIDVFKKTFGEEPKKVYRIPNCLLI